ncbi:MAG: hypothetical protein ACKOS8_20095 [Gemmataceae bacterium]
MKKAMFAVMFALAACAMVLPTYSAAQEPKTKEKKEVTLKGELCCAKCELKTADKCTNVIEYERKNKKTGETKKVVLVIDDEGAKAPYHSKLCTGRVKGSVTGIVGKKDDKPSIKPAKDGVKIDG